MEPRWSSRGARACHSPLGLVLHPSRDLGAVRVQAVAPESLEISPQLIQTVAPHRIHPAIAARLDAHQPRPLEHLQVLRHGGPAHWLAFRQLTHSLGLLAQRLEDVAAGGGCPCGKHPLGNHFLPVINNYDMSNPGPYVKIRSSYLRRVLPVRESPAPP